jgi:pilus assembly protein Flp/PilA
MDGTDQMAFFKTIIRDRSGATAVEYGFLVCLIAIAAMGSMAMFGNSLSNTLMISSTNMSNAAAN